jgi:hypothetical protein
VAATIFRTTLFVLCCTVITGCTSFPERDAFQDRRNELKRAAIDCGSNTVCLENAQKAQDRRIKNQAAAK